VVKRAGCAAGAQYAWARPDEDGVGLGSILPESKQENGLSVGAVGPKEHLADVMPGPGNALANQALSSAIGGLRR
jgi:hypothetical protein